MAYGERTICKASGCGQEIIQIGGGHRQRLYCDDNCRQRAFQARREQEHKDEIARRWQAFTLDTRNFLDWLMTRHGEDLATAVELAINREVEQRQQGLEQVQERFRAYVEMTNERLSEQAGALAQCHQHVEALREKQLARVDKLKMSKSDARAQLEQARADLLQIRAERAREQEEYHTLYQHALELKSQLSMARQQIKDLEARHPNVIRQVDND